MSRAAVGLAMVWLLACSSLAQDNRDYPPYKESILRSLGISNVGLYDYLPFEDWMAQAPTPPAGTVAERKTVFYRAWATLWMNTLPAEGAWTHPIVCPGSRFFCGTWLWDTGFHVLGLAYGGPKARQLALWQIEIVLNGQHKSGKLPRETWKAGAQFLGEGVQAPGILTLAAHFRRARPNAHEPRKVLSPAGPARCISTWLCDRKRMWRPIDQDRDAPAKRQADRIKNGENYGRIDPVMPG